MTSTDTANAHRIPANTLAQSLKYPPSAAKVLPLLKQLLMDMDTSIHQIAEVIRLDPGIAARVLHAANSVMYSRGERCTSVTLAVNRIGYDNIFEMVSNAVAEQVLVMPLNAYSLEAEEFWQNSVACALGAERLAELCDEDRNVAYTLGLLSGIGMVAIEHWVSENNPTLAFFNRGFPRDYSDSEAALLGSTNAEVGTIVLHSWDFPPEMSAPIRWQNTPLDSAGHRKLCLLLHCAKWIALASSAEPPKRPILPHERIIAALRIRPTVLNEIANHVRQKMQDVRRQLETVPCDAA